MPRTGHQSALHRFQGLRPNFGVRHSRSLPKTGPLPIHKLRVMLRDCIGTPPYRLKGPGSDPARLQAWPSVIRGQSTSLRN